MLRTFHARNIVITGFMGTGKTSVGRVVAARLDREFVDMDGVIVARQGLEISQIFEMRGEAFFRQLERALCVELAAREGLVIATGGGTLICAENRAVMGRTGILICLNASVAEILQRLSAMTDRPLLDVTDRRAQIRALLAARRAAYAAILYQVETTGLSKDTVVEQVVEISKSAN